MRAIDVIESDLVKLEAEKARLEAEVKRLQAAEQDRTRTPAERMDAANRRASVEGQVGIVVEEIGKVQAERKEFTAARVEALRLFRDKVEAQGRTHSKAWRDLLDDLEAALQDALADEARCAELGVIPSWTRVPRVLTQGVAGAKEALRVSESIDRMRLEQIERENKAWAASERRPGRPKKAET